MNSAADQQTGGVEPDAWLPDVSDMPLAEILSARQMPSERQTVLANALRRMVHEVEDEAEPLAAFANYPASP